MGRQGEADADVAGAQLARAPGHKFYETLNDLLKDAEFDRRIEYSRSAARASRVFALESRCCACLNGAMGGAKLMHMHVHSGDPEGVASALRELYRARKLTLAARDEPCDLEVVVATHPASPGWTSVYGGWGADDVWWQLSDKLTTPVVMLRVFDGDVLEARLANDGCEVDTFCSNPEYEGMSARSAKGQPKRWDSLCLRGKSWRDVQRVFKAAPNDPELAFIELGKLIGLEEPSLYPDHIDPSGPATIRLRFKVPPAPRRRIVRGPPRLRDSGAAEGARTMDLSAGAQSLGSMVYSEGGGAAGVDVTMVGTAIESGLLAIQCVEYRGWTSAVAVRTAEDGTCLVAQFPTSGVPAANTETG